MNIAIILSGGVGNRMGLSIPKQYVIVKDKPIIGYCYEVFLKNKRINGIIIVASDEWKSFLEKYLDLESEKFFGFASPGDSRQGSIINGMNKAKEYLLEDNDIVLLHDAARPNVSDGIINNLLTKIKNYDGVMPALPSKDTLYLCDNGLEISSLLDRDKVYAGQSPEAFKFNRYYQINLNAAPDEISLTRGSSEIAFKNGMNILIISGDEQNYKITTKADLEKFLMQKGEI